MLAGISNGSACHKMMHSLTFFFLIKTGILFFQYCMAVSPLLTFIYQNGLQKSFVSQNKIHPQRMNI